MDDRYWAWECDCKYPYYGLKCELKADLWSTCNDGSVVCNNGGTCKRRDYHINYTPSYSNGVYAYTDGGGFYHLNDTVNPAFMFQRDTHFYREQDQPWLCVCGAGFYGPTCADNAPPPPVSCPPNACQHGGTCIIRNDNAIFDRPALKQWWECKCPCGYAGATCEFVALQKDFGAFTGIGGRMQFCDSGLIDCQNGGSCVDNKQGTGFQCNCATSYYGQYCELKGKSAASSVVPSIFVVAVAAIVAALKF